MKRSKLPIAILISVGILSLYSKCSTDNKPNPAPPAEAGVIASWITKGDRSALLQKQTTLLPFNTGNAGATIEVDSSQTFQTVDGFGYSLTGGSAWLINKLSTTDKNALLQELFGKNENSIGISYLRISI
ncbi:MAG: glucosylceramidase, partial [Bacteroidota bacterium]